jgi:hypothetical protein
VAVKIRAMPAKTVIRIVISAEDSERMAKALVFVLVPYEVGSTHVSGHANQLLEPHGSKLSWGECGGKRGLAEEIQRVNNGAPLLLGSSRMGTFVGRSISLKTTNTISISPDFL